MNYYYNINIYIAFIRNRKKNHYFSIVPRNRYRQTKRFCLYNGMHFFVINKSLFSLKTAQLNNFNNDCEFFFIQFLL